ncbi:MAG: AAA family ATPase [Patescibacteria group bacterium]
MKTYLIEGLSGTGKTTVCAELNKRNYTAVDADEVFAHFVDPKTGLHSDEKTTHWMWEEEKFNTIVKQERDGQLFVCGGATNQENFKHHFDKIFTLHVDDNVLKDRLLHRTNNDYGKDPKELEQQLEWNKGAVQHSRHRGTTLIDATKPISDVVDEILKNL